MVLQSIVVDLERKLEMQGKRDTPHSEKEIVGKAQQGDALSISILYERYYDRIFRYVSFKTSSFVESEDITAEVFVKMIQSIQSFRWQGYQFSSWIFKIAHNLVVDYYRKKSRGTAVPLEEASSLHDESSLNPEDVEHVVDINLRMQSIQAGLRELTDLQKEVIRLRFVAGLSIAETASVVDKKENAVKALQHSGLKKLKKLLPANDLQKLEGQSGMNMEQEK